MLTGYLASLPAMETTVAELEPEPAARPANGSPNLGPSRRVAAWPQAMIASTRITSSQTSCGLMPMNGPSAASGNSGQTTSVARANVKPS